MKPVAKHRLKHAFTCACSGGGGFLAAHLGCIILPVAIASMGAAGVALTVPTIAMIGMGGAISAAGLGVWYKLRGASATKSEKKVVIGSAIAGFMVMSAFNMAAHRDHHQHNHHSHSEVAESENASADARKRFNEMSVAQQKQMRENAAALKMPLMQYVQSVCRSPV